MVTYLLLRGKGGKLGFKKGEWETACCFRLRSRMAAPEKEEDREGGEETASPIDR